MVNEKLLTRLKTGISYTQAMNYGVCKYRVYLMLTVPKSVVFPEQLRGLLTHKVMECVFRDLPIPSLKEMYDKVMNLDREDVVQKRRMDWGKVDRKRFAEDMEDYLTRFEVACRSVKDTLLAEGYEVVSAEKEYIHTITSEHPPCSVEVVIHPDLVLRHPEKGIVILDLKTGKDFRNALYNSKQLVLYCAVLEKVLGTKANTIGILKWDGIELSLNYRSVSDFEKAEVLAHHGYMHLKINNSLQRLESGELPHKAFYPNTRSRLCRRNTCSYFAYCPFGQEKEKREQGVNDETI